MEMDEEIKAKIASPDTWLRLLLMIGFAIVANVLIWLVWLIAAVQFISTIIIGRVNQNLDDFSGSLVVYLTRIFEYLVFRAELKPYPFSSWEEMVVGAETAAPKKKSSAKKRPVKKTASEQEAE